MSLDELRAIRSKTEKNNQTDAVIITQKDLARIKEATVIKTKEQLQQEKKLQDEQKEAALAKSKLRKQRMMEMDANRATKVTPTDWQVQEKNKAESLLSKAQKRMDEQLDDVKHMN